jgi:hypothetical protein
MSSIIPISEQSNDLLTKEYRVRRDLSADLQRQRDVAESTGSPN